MGNLYKLIYTSNRKPSCDDAEIEKILNSCKRNNSTKDITGALILTENKFIQYLEGDKDIIKLYDLIKTDPRHEKIVLLSYGLIKERIFPSWQMAYKKIANSKIEFLTDVNSEEKRVFTSLINDEKQDTDAAVKLIHKLINSK